MRRLSLFAGALVVTFFWLTARAQAPLPVEFFTKYDEFGDVKISPDGAVIAVLAGKYGRSMIVFTDLKAKKNIGGIRTPEDCEIDEYHWVSPTRVIYTIAQRQRDNIEPTPTGEIFAIDRDGGSARQLYGYRAQQSTLDTHIATRKASYATPELLRAPKKDPNHILIAEYPWRNAGNVWYPDPTAKPLISRLDVYSGKKQQLDMAPLGGARLLLDFDDHVRLAYGLNERYQEVMSWKPEPGGAWTSFEIEGFRDETVIPWRFSTDNRSVFLTGTREGEAFDALYRLDLQTKAIERVHAFEDASIDELITDFADREIVGVSGYDARQNDYWLAKDDPAAQSLQALQRAFPQQRVRVTSHSEDGKLVIVLVDSDVNPGDYYLFDTVTKHADFLRAGRIWIEPKQMRPKEPISLSARDGLLLQGYVTRPAGDGPHPMVVLPHGGPYRVRDSWEFDPEVQLLASRGYAVLQVNYRGSGGFNMDFERAGYREWGGKMQDDLTDATRWAIEQKIAAPDRICIYGASYGGYAALMGVVREPELYRCAIGYAGIYDLQLRVESASADWVKVAFERTLGTDVAKLRTTSPVYNAQNIKVPVLLIHGTADGVADFEHAKRMRAALEKNHKQFEFMELGGEGHGAYDEATRRAVAERILQFLAANLSARPGTP